MPFNWIGSFEKQSQREREREERGERRGRRGEEAESREGGKEGDLFLAVLLRPRAKSV